MELLPQAWCRRRSTQELKIPSFESSAPYNSAKSLSTTMRTDEEAQAVAQPAEEAETAANGHADGKAKEANQLPTKPEDAIVIEDRIEVKLEGKEHPWNWSKTR